MSLLGEIKEFKWDFFTQSRLDVIVNVHQKWDLFQFSWLMVWEQNSIKCVAAAY